MSPSLRRSVALRHPRPSHVNHSNLGLSMLAHWRVDIASLHARKNSKLDPSVRAGEVPPQHLRAPIDLHAAILVAEGLVNLRPFLQHQRVHLPKRADNRQIIAVDKVRHCRGINLVVAPLLADCPPQLREQRAAAIPCRLRQTLPPPHFLRDVADGLRHPVIWIDEHDYLRFRPVYGSVPLHNAVRLVQRAVAARERVALRVEGGELLG
mmetsp:Transcript_8079/g.11095  ORF Transcript_8079/g.11095 Transcript_8079/m.11095 type:complete len:209 (+) Transcript_8079:378-1004(+)